MSDTKKSAEFVEVVTLGLRADDDGSTHVEARLAPWLEVISATEANEILKLASGALEGEGVRFYILSQGEKSS